MTTLTDKLRARLAREIDGVDSELDYPRARLNALIEKLLAVVSAAERITPDGYPDELHKALKALESECGE